MEPQRPNLVYLDAHGIRGSNFYWHKHAAHGLSKADILAAGLVDERVLVAIEIVSPLQAVNRALSEFGWSLYVKEGFRSKELYEIVYRRRVEKYGAGETDSVMNMADMPHSTGLSVDVALWDDALSAEVAMRRFDDGTPALFVDFYQKSSDPEGKTFHYRQELVRLLMFSHGFRLGKKREYFHFNYRPSEPENY